MAPRRRNGGEGAESQAVHTLGIRGRKTGVALANTGEVDEHGFQPLTNVFSSPAKGAASANSDEDDDDAGSEEMELADPSSAGPGPRTLLKNQRNLQYPIPRSRSPAKTGITSPARRNPRLSSPIEEDRDATVTRKLDFAGIPRRPGRPNGANGTVLEEEEEEEEEEEAEGSENEPEDNIDIAVDADDGMDMVDDEPQPVEPTHEDEDSNLEEEEEEEEEEPVVQAPVKGRGRPKKVPVEPAEQEAEQPPSSQKKRGRPPKKGRQPALEAPVLEPPAGSRKRQSLRSSTGGDEEEQPEDSAEEEPRQPKRQKTQKQPVKQAPAKSATKPTAAAGAKSETARPRGRPGRKPKQPDAGEDVGETSFMALQKGPPMPKRRGLVSVKRPDEILQTRSGRHSFKPLHWWAGEQVIAEEEEQNDMFANDRDFVVRSMKEIRRVEEEDTRPSRKAPRPKARGKASKARLPAVEEGPELEEWETNPGTVTSDIIAWEPEYETHPPADDDQVHISTEQIAISADAVQTREIRDATFKFGKTLTMPFMGAGIVDLPPGSEKRPKNSRKMHMVFFVHYGKVKVTVNEDDFRISAGGQWFVPRGNYYSIANDYEQPARIFFSQACEVASQNAETSQLMAA